MPQVKMPNGDMVQFPDDMPKDQIEGMIRKKFPDAGGSRGGDLAKGFAHGLTRGVGGALMQVPGLGTPSVAELDPKAKQWADEGAPEGSSGWRKAGEMAGEITPDIAAGFLPGGRLVKTAIGTATGAMQPAKDWTERGENALIGGGSALIGQGAASYITKHRSALNALANEAIGSGFGASHLGPWGGLGGLYAGRNIGHLLQNLTGGRGLSDLVAALANNPGLAAAMGVKLTPYAEQAGQFVGQELGKPSQ